MSTTPIKCLAIGDGCVGKTCLLRSYTDKTYFSAQVTTTYTEYLAPALITNDKQIDLLLCDTTGAEAYDLIRSMHYDDTEVILLCFSLVEPSSRENVYERWLPEIRHYCPNVPVILVGTKMDLREDKPSYVERHMTVTSSYAEGLVVAKDIGAYAYLECSALTGEGVAVVFNNAAICGMRKRSQSNIRQLDSKCGIS